MADHSTCYVVLMSLVKNQTLSGGRRRVAPDTTCRTGTGRGLPGPVLQGNECDGQELSLRLTRAAAPFHLLPAAGRAGVPARAPRALPSPSSPGRPRRPPPGLTEETSGAS